MQLHHTHLTCDFDIFMSSFHGFRKNWTNSMTFSQLLVECCTGITEVKALNPVKAWICPVFYKWKVVFIVAMIFLTGKITIALHRRAKYSFHLIISAPGPLVTFLFYSFDFSANLRWRSVPYFIIYYRFRDILNQYVLKFAFTLWQLRCISFSASMLDTKPESLTTDIQFSLWSTCYVSV